LVVTGDVDENGNTSMGEKPGTGYTVHAPRALFCFFGISVAWDSVTSPRFLVVTGGVDENGNANVGDWFLFRGD
jgi:hypothetical protein